MDAGDPDYGADSFSKDKALPSLSPTANLVGVLVSNEQCASRWSCQWLSFFKNLVYGKAFVRR